MATVEASVAAATAVVNYNLFTGKGTAVIQAGQRVWGVALKGSAAAGDTEVRFTAGGFEIADIYNNGTGFPGRDDVIPTTYTHRGPPAPVFATVVDAPATHPINALIIIQ